MKNTRLKDKGRLAAFIAAVAAIATISTVAIAAPPFGVPGKPTGIDPVYGVCRGVDPACYNDWGTERDDAVLVYSRTAGPRHANLGPRLDPDHSSNLALDLDRPYVITHDYSNAGVVAASADRGERRAERAHQDARS